MSNVLMVQLKTPVGRIVAGSAHKVKTKDGNGNPLVVKNGPNTGQPRTEFYMGLAIPKTDPGYNDIYAAIYNEGRAGFPHLFDASGACILPTFAFKVVDGDSAIPNESGNKPCEKEGYPGNWVLNFSNGFAPGCYQYVEAEKRWAAMPDPTVIKRGDYAQVSFSIKGNQSTQRPGVYLNHDMVAFVGHGVEIITGPDPNQAFGNAPALPPGASATPLAPSVGIAPPPVPSQAAPPVGIAPPPAPPAGVTPAPDFLNTPAAPVKYQLPDGSQHTEADLLAAGWVQAQIAALTRV